VQIVLFPSSSPDDTSYLTHPDWRDRGITYTVGDEQHGTGWRHDHHRVTLTAPGVAAETIFEQARARLINMEIVSSRLLVYTAAWNVEGRLPQAGDLIFQRTHFIRLGEHALVDLLSAVRLGEVIDQPGLFELEYISTQGHPECGASRFIVSVDNNAVRLQMVVVSAAGLMTTRLVRPFTRWFQLKITHNILDTIAQGVRLDSVGYDH
jgi:uncharacterized protein (UPF0548 family)